MHRTQGRIQRRRGAQRDSRHHDQRYRWCRRLTRARAHTHMHREQGRLKDEDLWSQLRFCGYNGEKDGQIERGREEGRIRRNKGGQRKEGSGEQR